MVRTKCIPRYSFNHKPRRTFFPVHQILLAENGVYILENINTQALIDANGTAYPFLLMISPLPIVGASQTWITPIALL
jgi:kynurenine formamidase